MVELQWIETNFGHAEVPYRECPHCGEYKLRREIMEFRGGMPPRIMGEMSHYCSNCQYTIQ